MICNNCHNKNDKDAKFCRVCGTLLNTENTYDNKHLKYSNKKSSTSLKFVVALSCIVVCLGIFVIFKTGVFSGGENDFSSSTKDQGSNQVSSQTSNVEKDEKTDTTINKEVSKLYISNTDCSSILHDSTSINYGSSKAIDGDFSTVWSEGVSGFGQGEWIRLDLDSTYTIEKVKIVNGLVNNKNGYYNNNRPESITLSFSDGSSQSIKLEDNNTGYQIVNIKPVKSEYVKFTIDSVYYGQKYNDTCIADIEVLGY